MKAVEVKEELAQTEVRRLRKVSNKDARLVVVLVPVVILVVVVEEEENGTRKGKPETVFSLFQCSAFSEGLRHLYCRADPL